MDEIDIEILQMLRFNSRAKYVQIAKTVNLTEGAVRRRVKKMIEQKIIQKFTIESKSEVEGIILVKTDTDETRDIVISIQEVSNKVFEVSGEYDVAAFIQTYSIEELNRKVDEIRNLPGVLDTNTLIKLR